LPYFVDLLKNHFPGMVGASEHPSPSPLACHSLSRALKTNYFPPLPPVFVLNYSWMYAAMWAMAKRVMPQAVLERIIFPSVPELLEFFEPEHLLIGMLPFFSSFLQCRGSESIG
jgi:CRAL/TRIO domain